MKLNKKNRFLIIGFLLTLFVCYYFAIARTISSYKEYRLQDKLISENEFSTKYIRQLIQKEKQLNDFLLQQNLNSATLLQNDLLKFLSIHSSSCNVKIIEFNEPHFFKLNNSTELNYIFTLQGSFNDIVLLLNQIENHSGFGYVRHVNFVKKQNFKSNKDELFAEVILKEG